LFFQLFGMKLPLSISFFILCLFFFINLRLLFQCLMWLRLRFDLNQVLGLLFQSFRKRTSRLLHWIISHAPFSLSSLCACPRYFTIHRLRLHFDSKRRFINFSQCKPLNIFCVWRDNVYTYCLINKPIN